MVNSTQLNLYAEFVLCFFRKCKLEFVVPDADRFIDFLNEENSMIIFTGPGEVKLGRFIEKCINRYYGIYVNKDLSDLTIFNIVVNDRYFAFCIPHIYPGNDYIEIPLGV